MALTITLDKGMPRNLGLWNHFSTGTFAFDANYPPGGEVYADAQFGMQQKIDALVILGGTGVKKVEWDKTDKKMLVYVETAGVLAQAADGSDQSGLSAVRFLAVGW